MKSNRKIVEKIWVYGVPTLGDYKFSTFRINDQQCHLKFLFAKYHRMKNYNRTAIYNSKFNKLRLPPCASCKNFRLIGFERIFKREKIWQNFFSLTDYLLGNEISRKKVKYDCSKTIKIQAGRNKDS